MEPWRREPGGVLLPREHHHTIEPIDQGQRRSRPMSEPSRSARSEGREVARGESRSEARERHEARHGDEQPASVAPRRLNRRCVERTANDAGRRVGGRRRRVDRGAHGLETRSATRFALTGCSRSRPSRSCTTHDRSSADCVFSRFACRQILGTMRTTGPSTFEPADHTVVGTTSSPTRPSAHGNERVSIVSVGGGVGSMALIEALRAGAAPGDRHRTSLLIAGAHDGGQGSWTMRREAASIPDLDNSWMRRSTLFGDARRSRGIAGALRIAARGGAGFEPALRREFSRGSSGPARTQTPTIGRVERLDRSPDGSFVTTLAEPSGTLRVIESDHLHLDPGRGPVSPSDELAAFRAANPADGRARIALDGGIACVEEMAQRAQGGIVAVRGDGRTADRVVDWLLRHPSCRRVQVLHVCSVGRRQEQPHLWGVATDSAPCVEEKNERPSWRPGWFERALNDASRAGRYVQVRAHVNSLNLCRGRLRLVLETQAGPLYLLADRYVEAHRVPRPLCTIKAIEEFATRLDAARCDGSIDVGEDWSASALSVLSHRCFVTGPLAHSQSITDPGEPTQQVLAARSIARTVSPTIV